MFLPFELNRLILLTKVCNIKRLSSNGKFRSFLVRILIQKDNTDNKVFKKEFYIKETRKKGIEKKNCCKF